MRAIARKLNISRNTVRRYLRDPSPLPHYKSRQPRPTILDPYKPYLHARIEAAKPHWIPATVLFREISERGYTGGISTVRIYVSNLQPKAKIEPQVRFETEPGVQMQVDFTNIKRGHCKMKALVATLGYSRACFVRFGLTEKQEDWIEGIRLAFEYFGGVPKELLFDNARCIMLERDAYGEGKHRWNTKILDLSKQYGFKLKACKPYRAKTKGKVERFNRYLKESFITPLAATLKQTGLDLTPEVANGHVGTWLNTVAHQRIHATIKVKPQVRLDEEINHFLPLPHESITASFSATNPNLVPIPVESIQHELNTYDRLLEVQL
jgi:transposase